MFCVYLSNIMLIFFSVKEIEGVSLPKKKKNVPQSIRGSIFQHGIIQFGCIGLRFLICLHIDRLT